MSNGIFKFVQINMKHLLQYIIRVVYFVLSLNATVEAIKHSTEIVLYILFLLLNAIVGAIRNSTKIIQLFCH